MSSDPATSLLLDAATLSEVFDVLPNWVLLTQVESSHRYRILAVNRAFLQVLGLPRASVVGKTLDEAIPLPYYLRLLSHLQKAIHDRQPVSYRETIWLISGHKAGQVTIVPLLHENGRSAHIAVIVHEIVPIPDEAEMPLQEGIERANLQKGISALQQVCRDLSQAASVDELCRLAIEYGHSRLGFDRLSLWFLDPQTQLLNGTYGIDESGQIRDERRRSFQHPSLLPADIYLLQDMPITHKGSQVPLYNDCFEQVGIGELYSVTLSDGQTILGVLFCDNLLSGQPMSLLQREILVRYAHTISLLVWKIRTESAIREQNERYRLALQAGRMAFVEWDLQTDTIFMSDEMASLMSSPPDIRQLKGSEAWKAVHPDDLETVQQALQRALAHTGEYSAECRLLSGTGDYRWIGFYGRIYAENGENRFVRVVMRDISEERELRENLLQAQKMDAIGRLAGGIAHDFNNLLTIILGSLELARLTPDSPAEVDHCLRQIESTARRAADMTRQLLAFARKQSSRAQAFNLNEILDSLLSVLPRLMGEDILLQYRLEPHLWHVHADPSQIEQVILNLAVNARDAMPHGGTLILETRNVAVAANRARRREDVPAGEYVLLIVRDTGTGITPEIQHRVFEPFFTTKAIGKGTGLGLATSYGIVQQSGGAIRLESRLGEGTSFYVYLPRWIDNREEDATASQEQETIAVADAPRCVLVAEDEKEIRSLAAEALKKVGYTVLIAGDGAEALQIVEGYDGEIDLLFTDIVMPTMGGIELAAALQSRFPKMRVLYASGYTADFEGMVEGTPLLHKPYRMYEMLREVDRLLRPADAGA